MTQLQKEASIIVDDTYRRISLEQELPSKKIQRFQNVGLLRLKLSILCLSTFYWGYCLAYLSTLSNQTLITQFGSQTQKSAIKGLLIGILPFGGAAGAFFSPFFMRCLTRRNLILTMNIGALIIEGVIQYPNIYCLFICRAFQGFFVGNFMACVSIYINQLSPKQIKGTFGVYTQLFAMFGVVFSFGLGIILTKSNVPDDIMWRIMFGVNIITVSIVIISILLKIIPESPNSLIMIGDNDKAKEVINLFYKKEYVEQVFKQKLLEVEHQKNNQSKNQKQSLNYSWKAYFIGFQLPLMQQLTGINAIVTQIGGLVSNHNPQFGYYTPFIINFVQFAATFGAIYALNSFGRKTILVTGNLALGIFDILLGILFIFIDKFSTAFWLVFVILIFYMMFYSTTIGPTVWMYVPQIIPAKIVPFATMLNWLGCSFCIVILPIINQNFGEFAVFFLFGGLSLITSAINAFGVVQTKGLTIKQICTAYNE